MTLAVEVSHLLGKYTRKQTYTHANKPTHTQTNIHTRKQTYTHANKYTHTQINLHIRKYMKIINTTTNKIYLATK